MKKFHSKGGWFGHAKAHSTARFKGAGFTGKKLAPHIKKEMKQTARGLARDRAVKAKHSRQSWQPHWRGDVKGSRV